MPDTERVCHSQSLVGNREDRESNVPAGSVLVANAGRGLLRGGGVRPWPLSNPIHGD